MSKPSKPTHLANYNYDYSQYANQAADQQNYYDMLAQLDFLQGDLAPREDSKEWQELASFYRSSE